MQRWLGAVAAAALQAFFVSSTAQAQTPLKIGLVMEYSGQFADTATQAEAAIKLFMRQNGDTVAGRKIEIIPKDTGGPAPDTAKRLAQELIVRDKVDILAGWILSPNTLAAAGVSVEAKKLMVVMNAAAAIIPTKSPYIVRTSSSSPITSGTFGTWVSKKVKDAFTMVSDYAPGRDSEAAFSQAFVAWGGKIVGAVKMPIADPDFSAYVQRAKDAKAEGIYVWIPGGAQPAALGKALAEHGMSGSSFSIFSEVNLTDDNALKSMGDSSLGFITVSYYDWTHASDLNKDFVKAYREANNGRNPDVLSIGAWDGMRVIYDALKKTNGDSDGEKLIEAVKGLSWESPRGQVTISPTTRDIVETYYIRRVEKIDGVLQNVEFDKIEPSGVVKK